MPRFEKEEFEKAINGSSSIKEVLQNLNLKVNSGNYRAIHKYANEHELKLPIGKPNIDNLTFKNTIPDEEWFRNGVARNGVGSRKKLIAGGRLYLCEECGTGPEYNGKPLTLQVDHIDGNQFNNTKDNLRFLCPNCHTQTETYGSRNKDTKESMGKYSYCEDCNIRVSGKSKRCVPCNNKNIDRPTKIEWPNREYVIALVTKTSFLQAGKELGVSDNAIRKFLKRTGGIPNDL